MYNVVDRLRAADMVYHPPEISELDLTTRDLEIERDMYKGLYENACEMRADAELEAMKTEGKLEELQKLYIDARSLLDGCYEIVEIWKAETPSQVKWKRNWLEAAKKHGASGL